ncbi:methyltransferase [Thermaerobacter marianensis DSM 12885]|uniref:Methyltransferase n=1 Tax=Thermaerobacter marianensis (strain ATCC 700841 / DSM 12885 / JCM 10246 / 7p75a) TaxID=644966 RepID=E6SJB9_THEM7|nr:16S rRNA (guanine(966)-N(2))-methyltransferase RsmD [Thermaerobacter marianensis]ADU51047.1 methyltransferase [Thermaerobacter marianensis DSM 12885]
MRVTGGRWRGRPLRVPAGRQVRPTTDRVRQALFNILGPAVEGARVLDLFAGTGSLAIEALSRGAREALLVEADRRVVALLGRNLRELGLGPEQGAVVWRQDVFAAIAKLADGRRVFDLILADPPYRQGVAPRVVQALGEGRVLAPGGWLVVEHDPREALPDRAGGEAGVLVQVDARRYGDTALAFYRCRPAAEGKGETR